MQVEAFELAVSTSLTVASKDTLHSIFKTLLSTYSSSDEVMRRLITYGSHAANIPQLMKLAISRVQSLEVKLITLHFCVKSFRLYKNWSVFVEITDMVLTNLTGNELICAVSYGSKSHM